MDSTSLYNRARALVWDTPLEGKPAWHVTLIEAGQISWAIARDLIIDGRINLRAMSLVYTTLLALVPTLAIAFAIFRAFGFDSYIQQLLTEFLGPLGASGSEITLRVMEFVQRVNANVLGTIGFAFLLYTVISMINKVEEAFNNIWHVQASRSITRQFAEIVSMGVLGPLVVFTALGLIAGAVSNSFIGGLADYGPIHFLVTQMSRVVPYAVLILTFTFLYRVVPNTRVDLSAALVGATVAGIAWGATGWAFAIFVVKSAQYVAIYSAFAGLVVFMIWLYAAWVILLVGCAIAFYYQNRHHLSPVIGLGLLTPRQQQRMAVQALIAIHENFAEGRAPWTDDALSRKLHLPMEALQEVERALNAAGLITRSADSPSGIIPTRPAHLIPIADVIDALQVQRNVGGFADRRLVQHPRVAEFFDRLSSAENETLKSTTIASLMETETGPIADPVQVSETPVR